MRDYSIYKKDIKSEYARYFTDIYKYNEIDNYNIGDKFNLRGQEWVIFALNKGNKKLYHCENSSGLKESFHAIDFN